MSRLISTALPLPRATTILFFLAGFSCSWLAWSAMMTTFLTETTQAMAKVVSVIEGTGGAAGGYGSVLILLGIAVLVLWGIFKGTQKLIAFMVGFVLGTLIQVYLVASQGFGGVGVPVV